ncbi:MAG: hypothetical protein DCO96_05265 [Fluviicola sp. XM-24bin1]|nr:MAG: hypothetical protein DCO96_05265 [Fluviicola sp. XM-24bin1]
MNTKGIKSYIRSVKFQLIFSLVLASLVLTGCPDKEGEEFDPAVLMTDLEKIQANNMDLPNSQRYTFGGIRYRLSELFRRTYKHDFVLADEYEVRVINQLNLYFSIERFSEYEAEGILYQFDNDEMSLLDAVHDNYAIKRNASLEKATISIKKAVPESVGYPGVMQTISGKNYSRRAGNTYFMATLDINGDIYVAQLIGKEENMGYLYDDFIDIISSISI